MNLLKEFGARTHNVKETHTYNAKEALQNVFGHLRATS